MGQEVKFGSRKKPSLADSNIADDIDLTKSTTPHANTPSGGVRPKPATAARLSAPSTIYRDFVAKTTRIRDDQNQALTRIARELNRNKQEKSAPRITENTLIRIALNLLLEHEHDLHGDTEALLLRTTTHHEQLPKFRTSELPKSRVSPLSWGLYASFNTASAATNASVFATAASFKSDSTGSASSTSLAAAFIASSFSACKSSTTRRLKPGRRGIRGAGISATKDQEQYAGSNR